MSKEALYNKLQYKGQVLLPPFDLTTIDHLKSILSGAKKYLHIWEVCPVKVLYPQVITIKTVLNRIQDDPFAMSYLPDEPHKHCSREFLFQTVSSLDSSFFLKLEKEVEKLKPSKVKNAPASILITP